MFQNKKIFILGMARSGYEVALLLSKYNNQIFITDQKEQDSTKVEELAKRGIVYQTLEDPSDLLDDTYDYVIKNPGIRKDQKCVLKAHELSIPVINELEVAYTFLPKDTFIIGITGSNGKTTTTTMLYDILKAHKDNVYLAGNIGVPLSKTVSEMREGSILVMEISDHQLLDMYNFKTNISVLTNLSEVHLDFHGSYENYKNIKKRIFNHHTKDDLAIINAGNEDSLLLTDDIASTKVYFAGESKKDIYFENNTIYLRGTAVLDTKEIRLKGMHNYENIMCVLLVLDALQVPLSWASEYLKTFSGVEHRIEYVNEINGITFYNDSKSTNTESTITALKTFDTPVILILGGYDRGHDFHPLDPYMEHVKEVLCYGETKDRIWQWCHEKNISVKVFNTLEKATKDSFEDAEEGDTVLLSPACASWDQYTCFEDRGNEFKKIVNHK